MRRSPGRCRLPLALAALLLVAACSGGSSTPAVVNQVITPCNGATTPTVEGTTPTIVPVFDVWEASFAPPTPRPTATSATPTAGTPGASTPTPRGSATPTPTLQENILAVSVDTVNSGNASEFRLTVACQGTVVVPATIDDTPCTFPPPPLMPGDMPLCPSASVDLNDFGFGDLRRVGCLIEIGPTEPLQVGVGMCADPTHADYKLKVTLNGDAALSLTLAANNCRAAESCLQEVFGIDVGN